MNTLKTALLLAALTVLFVYGGFALGGQQGMVMAFIFAVVMNFGSWFFSDKLVLSMYRAQEIRESEAPWLYDMVRQISRRAGIPMPRLYLIPDDQPNAFATGRDPEHAVVAVTQGITRVLNRDELAGVLAHEIAHVKNRDILIGSIAATIAGAVSMLAHLAQWAALFGGHHGERGGHPLAALAMMIVAPIAALLIQMAISRSREYEADRSGAEFIGDPRPLASALRKLSHAAKSIPMQNAEPATAHMFIVSPLTGQGLASLFSTHPPVEERISALLEMRPGAVPAW